MFRLQFAAYQRRPLSLTILPMIVTMFHDNNADYQLSISSSLPALRLASSNGRMGTKLSRSLDAIVCASSVAF